MLKQLFTMGLTTLTLTLTAAPLDYIKDAPDKGEHHQMRNIDFIYMINLDERPEKFKESADELGAYGIVPYRFSAVNGWKLSLNTLNDVGVKFESWMSKANEGTCYLPEDRGQPHHEIVHVPGRNYFCHCMSRGAIGIVLSHLSILVDAYKSGYKTIWIMEDDIEVIRDPNILSKLVGDLDKQVGKKGWDILFTDRDTKNQKGEYVPCQSYAWRPNFTPEHPERFAKSEQINEQFRKIGARYGAYSMIVRRSGMKKLIDFINQYRIFLPYDMEFYLSEKMRLYTVLHDVVSTRPRASSDNGAPNYEKKQ